jgi:hypothetical protein
LGVVEVDRYEYDKATAIFEAGSELGCERNEERKGRRVDRIEEGG